MQVPNESKLFVLTGLDINHFSLFWVYFTEIQPFWPNFLRVVLGMSRQSRQGLGHVSTTSQQRWSYYWSSQELVRCLDTNLGVSSKVACLQSHTESYRALQSLEGWKWSNRVINCSWLPVWCTLVQVSAEHSLDLDKLIEPDLMWTRSVCDSFALVMAFDTIPAMLMSLDKNLQNLQNSWKNGLTMIVLVFYV